MKKAFTKLIKHIATWLLLLFAHFAIAQQSVTTTNSFLNNNGTGTVVFNLQNTNPYPIILQEFHSIIGITGSSNVEIYFNNTPVSGTPATLTTANGWNLVANGTTTGNGNTTTTTTVPLLTGLSLIVPANTTIGVAVWANGQRYFTIPTSVTGQTIDSSGGVRILSGVNTGYATTTAPPAAPTIAMRGWVGTIVFSPAIPCSGTPYAGDATSSLSSVCANQNFSLSLTNDSIRQNLMYQWLSSTTGANGTYSPMLNDTSRNITKSQTATTWYRCVVTCGTFASDTSSAVMVTTPVGALNGSYTINPSLPMSGTNYHNLADIVTALNCNGVTGPVTITLAPGLPNIQAPLNFLNITGTSATNTITIVGNGNTVVSSGISPIVSFNSTRYVIWDSLNVLGAGAFGGFGIYMTGISEYLTIKNSTINVGITSTASANCAIVASGSNTTPTTVGNNARYITIQNNEIIGGYYGIVMIGTASYLNSFGHLISNNRVSNFYWNGIYLNHADTTIIEGNQLRRDGRATISTCYGIYLNTGRFIKVRNNRIFNLGTGSYTCYPIWFATSINSAGFESEIINNAIYNNNTSSTYYPIYFSTSTTGFKIYHNTVHDNTTLTTGARRNIFFAVAPNLVDLRNNIFVMEGSGTGAKHNIYVTTTSASFTANRNVYFMGATAGTNSVGFWGANNTTLSDWQTASSQDANSVNANPVFTNIAAGNFTPISVNVDNLGSNVGVTTDIFGNTRSTTTPDVGAAEFTGISGDVSVVSGSLTRSSVCYSLFDTVRVTVQNLIGPTINFTNDPLTVVYEVNGPVATIDSFVVTTGTLAANGQLTLTNNNVNMSLPGNYSLTAYVRPNSVNNIASNDTIRNASTVEVRPILSVTPKTGIANSPTDTFVLTAQSPLFPAGGAIITEICHFKTTVGQPTGGWPAYLIADDYIEITGVPNSDLAGFTLEEWSATALVHTVTFPTGTLFGPNGTMVVATGQLGTSVPSPANFYYHSGNTATKGSTGVMGYLIKNPNGDIVDAVVYGTLTFPAASGVTTSHWSGNTPAVSSSGNRLVGPDTNNPTNWVNSGTSPQDPNVLNSGVPLPQPGNMAGFNWYFLFNAIDTNAKITVGPYTTPGTYQYVAVYNTVCGLFTDTVTITATQNVPVKLNALTARKFNSDVVLNWSTASEINNSYFAVERSLDGTAFEAIGTVKGNGTTARLSNYNYTDNMAAEAYSHYNTLYYRLKQYDFDGSFAYSKTVAVNLSSAEKVKANIYPNPNTGSFELSLSAVNGNQVTVDIYDMTGNLVYSQQFSGNALQQMLVQHNLNSGLYTANIKHNGAATAIKFVVQ